MFEKVQKELSTKVIRQREEQALLQLAQIQGLGVTRIPRLLRAFGSGFAALNASVEELEALDGFGKQLAHRIVATRGCVVGREEWERMRSRGIRLLLQGDSEYPEGFLRLPDPPPLLFLAGKRVHAWNPNRLLAVVGSRKPDAHGREWTRRDRSCLGERWIWDRVGRCFGN